jgi:hypothetical protein
MFPVIRKPNAWTPPSGECSASRRKPSRRKKERKAGSSAGTEEAGEEATTKPIADEIGKIREELAELEGHLPDWDQYSESSHGSKKYRGVERRIVLSSQRLEELVKENTCSR